MIVRQFAVCCVEYVRRHTHRLASNEAIRSGSSSVQMQANWTVKTRWEEL